MDGPHKLGDAKASPQKQVVFRSWWVASGPAPVRGLHVSDRRPQGSANKSAWNGGMDPTGGRQPRSSRAGRS